MQRQSPINLEINNNISTHDEELAIHWKSFDARLEDTGYLVRAYGDGGYALFKNQRFDFIEFHFHTPSEHHINNQRFPMEIHFVHHHKKLDQYVVIAVLIEAKKPSSELQKLINALDIINQNKSFNIDPRLLLPQPLTTFSYDGSLTTMPCTESVSWQILSQPNQAGQKQIDAITSIRSQNARELQPLYDRPIHRRRLIIK